MSLAGVYQPAKEIEKSKVPAALARALKMHPEVKTIVLHLDNDRIGRLATKAISAVLPKQYQVKDVPPKQGKDYNDLLCIKLNLAITKREKSMYLSKNRPSISIKQVNVLFQEDLLKLYTILKETKLLCHYHIDTAEISENRLDF